MKTHIRWCVTTAWHHYTRSTHLFTHRQHTLQQRHTPIVDTQARTGRRAFQTRTMNGQQENKLETSDSSVTVGSWASPEAVTFLHQAADVIISKALQDGHDVTKPVVEFKHPEELKSLLDLELGQGPCPHERLLELMETVIRYSVRTGHVHFYNQLYAATDPYSQVGAWLTEALNTNIHTYEVCPVFILVEQYMVNTLCQAVGFEPERGDGLFLPGGSASNTYALHLARYRKFPEVKDKGLYGLPRLRLYMAEDAHYSLKKAANFLGLGIDSVVPVRTDHAGRMDVQDLEDKVMHDKQQGLYPLFVMSTSGTTVLGAYDPLAEISDVCERHGLWHHNDACWGGAAILSPKYKHWMKGSELCQSISWNFHKLSGTNIQCSALLVQQKGLMEASSKANAEYLFQPDKFYDTDYDIGDKTIMCGRKADGFKLWLQWKALGTHGMAARVERAFDNAQYLADKITKTPGFRLVTPEMSCSNVCFWYIPPRLRDLLETDDWWQEIKNVAPEIKERMVKAGSMMIGFQPLSSRGLVNFFRIVINSPANTHQDMDFVLEEIDRCGRDL